VSVDPGFASGYFTRGAPPTGTRLVLVRHGEAHCNANGVVGGPRGCGGLTEVGRAQARALRERLRRTGELDDVEAVYTSVLPRAIQTAALLAPALPALDAVQDCDLCELHPGEGDALTWDQLRERFGIADWNRDPGLPFAPGGESWVDFYERCRRTLGSIVDRHPGQRVLLVVHGGVIEQAMKIYAGDDPGVRLGLRTEHCTMTEIEFAGERRRLLRYNDASPLGLE